MKTVKLNNGVEMPQMGYGVYQVSESECERCVSDALKVGYRMIDTAQAYHNEEGVGNAVKKSGIDRKEIFLVSKIWISNYGYEKAKASIDESLRKLQTDYIDLMLLHQPFCDRYGAYRALEEAYKEGKLRAIGVSNFYSDHFIDIASNMDVVPAVNQVETHVFNQQIEPQKIMEEFGTRIMSWGPVCRRSQQLLHKSLTCRNRCEIRQKCSTGRSSLVDPARCHHHPKIHAYRTYAAEYRHLRFRADRRRYGFYRHARHGKKSFLRSSRCGDRTNVYGLEVIYEKEFR